MKVNSSGEKVEGEGDKHIYQNLYNLAARERLAKYVTYKAYFY